MYTFKNDITTILEIKKSKFICKNYFVTNKSQVKTILDSLKKQYDDATHICYAYIINAEIKLNDDNEPNNTAGMPIYNVLKKNNLNYCLAVVIRYFGGIKLGAGGLVRAYTNSVCQNIVNNTIEIENGYEIELTFNYSNIKEIDYQLKNYNVIKKEFEEMAKYTISCSKKQYIKLKSLTNIIQNIKIIKETIIKSVQ